MKNQTDQESRAIAELVQQQCDAWNAGDAKRFASGFQADGCFVNILGALTYGLEPFEAQHAKIFSTVYDGSRIKMPIRRIHFLRPDVAIVDIDAELSGYLHLPPGITASDDGILHTRLQEVLSREREGWMVASFHNVDVKPGAPPAS